MKPRKLDKERPFGQVYGLNGVHFEQDDRYYNISGDEVTPANEEPPIEEEPKSNDNGADVKPAEVVHSPEPVEVDDQDYETMHHMRLKQCVKMFGGDYTTREAAVKFLKGQKAA